MGINYNKDRKKITIDWDEKQKNEVKHWHAEFTPINIFFHPKRKTQLIRVTLEGKIPKWVERFASTIKFKFGITSDNNGKQGFWLANWNAWESGEFPITYTNLDGAIQQLIKKIPDDLKPLKERIKSGKSIIKENLFNRTSFFERLGIYYRPEELHGNCGTLLFGNNIFPDKEKWTDEEYAGILENDGKLEKIIGELTTSIADRTDAEQQEGDSEYNPLHYEVLQLEELGDIKLEEYYEEIQEAQLSETSVEIKLNENCAELIPNEDYTLFNSDTLSELNLLESEIPEERGISFLNTNKPRGIEEGHDKEYSKHTEVLKKDVGLESDKGKADSFFILNKENESVISKNKKNKRRKKPLEQETIPLF
ncbi:hypothetical protein QTG56_23835 (plasmid) [Rossellomorea sp. AcN35-11]|nr:hypothetical protein [Rossellomorea aquimaris]WJV32393.1 hypothetical protein QTG56_23835 [Rossellomorea sp. AcN35-11]